ncbi:hypothetical protein Pla144_21540 [Bythopirellula polymerisocia]|uniref:Uncharacterized protein n=1 Tax=Bythopirellula polymerisocia TaxID=2528003 RepID=A0A5C6CS98_9BACT|nr:hypothetical protein Pla144_21540 [Bythopirellula polymerisocia]
MHSTRLVAEVHGRSNQDEYAVDWRNDRELFSAGLKSAMVFWDGTHAEKTFL